MANKHICGHIKSSAFTEITKSMYVLLSIYQVTIKINTTSMWQIICETSIHIFISQVKTPCCMNRMLTN